ncbi:MAG: TrkH family potassium uptake protein [Desulfobulbaceae bacterium]|nr:TrkH family potassium uptake protein [Desulfobulbaceae bacterium]
MTVRQISTLYFAVRPRVIGKYIGQLLIIYSILTCVPLIFCLLAGEYGFIWPYAGIVTCTAVLGLLLQQIEVNDDIRSNETLVISALIFIVAPLFAAIPFLNAGLHWSDAIFEAVSGVTTTGLSNLSTIETLPRTFLFSRAWLQWVGGLGIVVLGVAILLPHSKSTLQLFRENWYREGFISSTKAYARVVLIVYFLMTAGGFLLLVPLGVSWFDSATHVLAAVSTGGFSSFDNSLAGFNNRFIQTVIIFLSCLGAVPFILYYLAVTRGRRSFAGNVEVMGLAAAALFAAAAITMILLAVDNLPLRVAVENGTLLALSAQTTTGFSTMPVAGLSPAVKFILIMIMLIGGNVGSTAGGIKILRLLIIFKLIKLLVVRSGMPSDAVIQPRLMGKRLESVEIERCFLLVFLFLAVILLSWFLFILMGYPFLDSLFEVVSATCTVGLSTGICSTSLPVFLKGILCLDMLMGRLEVVAFLVLFYPPTWFGTKRGD